MNLLISLLVPESIDGAVPEHFPVPCHKPFFTRACRPPVVSDKCSDEAQIYIERLGFNYHAGGQRWPCRASNCGPISNRLPGSRLCSMGFYFYQVDAAGNISDCGCFEKYPRSRCMCFCVPAVDELQYLASAATESSENRIVTVRWVRLYCAA